MVAGQLILCSSSYLKGGITRACLSPLLTLCRLLRVFMGTSAANAAAKGAGAVRGGVACQRVVAGVPPPPVGTVPSHVQQLQAAGVPQLGAGACVVRVGAPPAGLTPGAGPSCAPPPPSSAAVWVDGSWCVYVAPPPPLPPLQAPHAPAALQPQRAQRRWRREAAPRTPQQPSLRFGYCALLFCPARALSLSSGGAPLRVLLSMACSSAGSLATGLGDAFAALAMSRVVWLGDARTPADVRRPTALRLGGVPGRFVAALVQHYHAVRAVLRKEHGWRMVLLEDGRPLPVVSADTVAGPAQHSNRFATLAACAPDADPSCLHGLVVKRRFGRRDWYGVVTPNPDPVPPYVFVVSYTDGDSEGMRRCDVQRRIVASWGEVPHPLHDALRALGGRMPGSPPMVPMARPGGMPEAQQPSTPAAPPQAAFMGRVVKRRFDRAEWFGVATFMPQEAPPFVFHVHYPDGDCETMRFCDVKRCAVQSWACVPQGLHADLVALGACMPGQEQATAPVMPAPTCGAGGAGAPASRPVPAARKAARAHSSRRRRRTTGRARAAAQRWSASGLRVAAVNVRGMTVAKAAALADLLPSLHIGILGVTETCQGRCQSVPIPGYRFIGKPRAGGQGGGIGFYVADALLPLVTATTATALPECMWVQVASGRSGTPPLCVGVVYIPPSALLTQADSAAVFAALQQDVNTVSTRGTVCLLGDFNCRVGSAACEGEHVGKWGEQLPALDHRGQAMRAFLVANDLFALNGRAPCREPAYTREAILRQATPDADAAAVYTSQRAVLDYVLVPRHLALPQAGGAGCCLRVEPRWRIPCTDHCLLWSSVPHSVPLGPAKQLPAPLRPRVHLLTTPSTQRDMHRAAYADAVAMEVPGFLAQVQQLTQTWRGGGVTAQRAVGSAKEALLDLVHAAVAASIGFSTGGSARRARPAIWSPAAAAAVDQQRQAAELLSAARAAAGGGSAADVSMCPAVQAAQAAYVHAERGVKTAVAAARSAAQAAAAEDVHRCAEERDVRGLWRGLRRLGGAAAAHSSGPAALQSSAGALVVDDQRIADTLAAHYNRVCDPVVFAHDAGFDAGHHAAIEVAVSQLRHSTSLVDSGPPELCSQFTDVEVAVATARLHNHKAPSPLDAVSNELLKYGGGLLNVALAAFFNLQWETETKAQAPGVIRSLYKRGDATLPTNYRPITLGSTVDKLYNACLNARIVAHLEHTGGLHEGQQGFRVGRGTVDNIFMLVSTLQGRLRHKLTTYLLFLDVEKAYDSVWRAGLLWHVWHAGVRGRMFRVLAQMCDSPTSCVLHNGHYSTPFHPGMGWEQGDTLATTMFNIHVNAVLSAVWAQQPGVPLGPGPSAEGLVALMFADDLVGMADSPERMQALINAVQRELTRWRIKASVSTSDASKTAVMVVKPRRSVVAGDVQWNWGSGGVHLPVVRSYRYLGVVLSDDGTWEQHIAARLAKGTKAACALRNVLQNSSLPWEARKAALEGAVLPVTHYAAAVWSGSTQAARQRLDSWQMGLVAGMVHCPPNTSHACLQQELGIQPLHVTCDMQALNFWHRLRCLPASRLLVKVATAWGGAGNPWTKHITKLLADYSIDAAATRALSRAKFKALVRQQAATRVQQLWAARGGSVLSMYRQHYGGDAGQQAAAEGKAQGFFVALSHQGRGKAAELCLKVRAQCLQLCGSVHRRRGEPLATHKQRQMCPCCGLHEESEQHFLLECPEYSSGRQHMFAALAAASPRALSLFQTLPAAQQCWQLLHFDFWVGEGRAGAPFPCGGGQGLHCQQGGKGGVVGVIAGFVADAWIRRSGLLACSALNGCVTNGGNPEV